MVVEKRTFVVKRNIKREKEEGNDYRTIIEEQEIPIEKIAFVDHKASAGYECASYHFEQREILRWDNGNIFGTRIVNKSPEIFVGTRISEEEIIEFLGEEIGEALISFEKEAGNEDFCMCGDSRLILGMPEGSFDFLEYREWEEYNEGQYPYSAYDFIFAKDGLLRTQNDYEACELDICQTSEYGNNWGLMYRVKYLDEYGRKVSGVKEEDIPAYVPTIREIGDMLSEGMFSEKIHTQYANAESKIGESVRTYKKRLKLNRRFWDRIEKEKSR